MHLDLHITNKCNLHCVHCVYDSGALPMPDLTLAMVKDLSASLRALDVEEVHITGGEPLLNPECFQILSFLKDVGLTVKIQSNGMLLDPAAVHRLRQAGVGHILVSLDGLRETHDSFRNHPGAYDAAVQAIRNCVAAGLFTRVNTVVHRGNLRDLPALLGRVDALGVNQHSFFFLTPLGRAKRLAGSLLSFHEWRQVVASLIQETRPYAPSAHHEA